MDFHQQINFQVLPDNTIAKQCPFLTHFTSSTHHQQPSSSAISDPYRAVLDVMPVGVSRFAASAALKETIDQLFYPSTYSLTANCLTSTAVFQLRVPPIQQQLLVDIE